MTNRAANDHEHLPCDTGFQPVLRTAPGRTALLSNVPALASGYFTPILTALIPTPRPNPPNHLPIASKASTESVILGEIAEERSKADRIVPPPRRELGGTRLVWNALVNGQ